MPNRHYAPLLPESLTPSSYRVGYELTLPPDPPAQLAAIDKKPAKKFTGLPSHSLPLFDKRRCSAIASMAAMASTEPAASKAEKKQKKEKSSKSDKKRAREEEGVADTERKHKKSKSISGNITDSQEVPVENGAHENGELIDKKKKKKEKKEKKSKHDDKDDAQEAAEAETTKPKKKSKKSRDQVRDDGADTDADAAQIQSQLTQESQRQDDDAMDIDAPAQATTSDVYQPPDIPSNPQFPFFSQTVSLYEAVYPVGWAEPVTSCEYQYLRHLQNKYVPSLRGVLMDYKNVTLGAEPTRVGATKNDEMPTTLKSQREYAVGFGWITADVELFVPSRGAWMEGSVNLQTEGHIGVVCFGKFNASIEARRLPPSWKWVSNEDPEAEGMEETGSVVAPDEHGVVHQIHSTGFWVDANGDKIKGKIRFRIRNYDVGSSGETTYLSLEGTMLDKAAEKNLVKEEARTIQARRNNKGSRVIERRRVPEFSMTTFMSEEAKQEQEARQEQEAEQQQQQQPAVAEIHTAAEGSKIVFDD